MRLKPRSGGAPDLHDGPLATLRDVVEFHKPGGGNANSVALRPSGPWAARIKRCRRCQPFSRRWRATSGRSARLGFFRSRWALDVFEDLLPAEDAGRASLVLTRVLAHGLDCASTGGLAIDLRLHIGGKEPCRRRLGDLGFVVVGIGGQLTPHPAEEPRAVAVLAIVTALTGSYLVWRLAEASVQAAVRFEVRLAEERPVPGLTVAEVGDSGRLVYLHPEIVVANDDVLSAWVTEEGDFRFAVNVELTSAGAERMRQATSAHLGRPVAIVVDGRVTMAPIVRTPIDALGVISGRFSKREAERVAEGIQRGPAS